MATCPNCDKELKWLPKGKHTCLCGEVISTDGEDLKQVEIALINVPAKEKFPKTIDIQLSLAIFFVLTLFALRIFYHETILQFETGIMVKLFSISPESYKQALIPFILAAIIILWFSLRFFRKIRQ